MFLYSFTLDMMTHFGHRRPFFTPGNNTIWIIDNCQHLTIWPWSFPVHFQSCHWFHVHCEAGIGCLCTLVLRILPFCGCLVSFEDKSNTKAFFSSRLHNPQLCLSPCCWQICICQSKQYRLIKLWGNFHTQSTFCFINTLIFNP